MTKSRYHKKEENIMKKQIIVKLVTVGLVALLLPLLLTIPAIPLNLETLVSLGGGLIVFYLITCFTARTGYKKWIALVPVAVVLVIGISYIPFTLSGWQLLGYYVLVVIALLLSAGSHLLGWMGVIIGRRRRHHHSGDDEDE